MSELKKLLFEAFNGRERKIIKPNMTTSSRSNRETAMILKIYAKTYTEKIAVVKYKKMCPGLDALKHGLFVFCFIRFLYFYTYFSASR